MQGDTVMKFTYDPRYNIGYIRFKEKPVEVESIKLSDELVVDIAPDGAYQGQERLDTDAAIATTPLLQ